MLIISVLHLLWAKIWTVVLRRWLLCSQHGNTPYLASTDPGESDEGPRRFAPFFGDPRLIDNCSGSAWMRFALITRYQYGNESENAQGIPQGRVTVGVMLRPSDLIAARPDARPQTGFPLPNSNMLSGRQVTSTRRRKGFWGKSVPVHQWLPAHRCILAAFLLSSAEILSVVMLEKSFRCRFFHDSSAALDNGPMAHASILISSNPIMALSACASSVSTCQ
ncbi:hypothetical protein BO94DRAFT_98766 [Aspergillus sclerotioniger CBS 115572]|uniref:Secreted protein n=1 Tax=Aspergillus sclerotioniger CBS 115572 TaxID=1450535 RepID=A0A317WH85_9EURO|nr:hypothetical protein BO94DRAFT_98766 [Aspergillus sclerotioniger CBS 115572]PWY85846.1 hypothetical protein BO94DRAFT_98766 [Aspergillus sclerotioniger CBS 115572]